MTEKQTIVDQIEVTRNGTVQVRLACQVVVDGQVMSSRWHRTAIAPGVNVDDQIDAVNAHLSAGIPVDEGIVTFPTVDHAGISEIKQYAKIAHTPARVKAYRTAVSEVDVKK